MTGMSSTAANTLAEVALNQRWGKEGTCMCAFKKYYSVELSEKPNHVSANVFVIFERTF